jgi:multiple sugar transport system ATP-binding protein
MTMGDRIAIMRSGVLQQTGEPQRVYDHPVNLFVASFIGSPPMNLVEARLDRANGGLVARIGEQELSVPSEVTAERPAVEGYTGRAVAVGIRPEYVGDLPPDAQVRAAVLRGHVKAIEALGSEVLVHVDVAAEPVLTDEVREIAVDVDAAALDRLESDAQERRTMVVGVFESSRQTRIGEEIEVAVDARKLHFFDLETGLAIYGERD